MRALRAHSYEFVSSLAGALASNTITMPISVQIEDERGLPEGEPWWHPRSTAAIVADRPGTCCLRFIDPYGNTTFNQAQLPVLLEELRALQSAHSDIELASVVGEACSYMEAALDQVHTYVRFIGD